jgi:alkylation response protein AidB-like acyl-CoA dehydrogenase
MGLGPHGTTSVQLARREMKNHMQLDHETFTLLKEAISRFVEKRLLPAENAVEELDDVPADVIDDMKEPGLLH